MITNLHELAECFLEPVTFEKVFPDSRSPSNCIRGRRGVVMYDIRNSRFTFRRLGSIRKYLNFDPNRRQELTAAAHACGLTFRPRERRMSTNMLPALTPSF